MKDPIQDALATARRELLRRPPPGITKREVTAWWESNVARIARDLHDKHRAGEPLHVTFAPLAAPQPGQKGVRPASAWLTLVEDVQAMLDAGERVFEDPETATAWRAWAGDGDPDEETDDDGDGWRLSELVPVPPVLPVWPKPLSPQEQDDLAAVVLELVGQTRGIWTMGRTHQLDAPGLASASTMPRWAAEAVLADRLSGEERLGLTAVSPDEAQAFIARHHSHLPEINRRGLLYALGVRRAGRLVCVGTVGTPTGRWNQPERVVELTRVACDGTTRGAASMLVARVIDALPLVSPRGSTTEPPVLVTYSLGSEEGTVYRALKDKGLRPVARVEGRPPAGARGGSDRSLARVGKVRWEAGPGASPADWSLLNAA